MQGCTAALALEGQAHTIPKDPKVSETLRESVALSALVSSPFAPVSASTGGSLMRSALLARAMSCPSNEKTKTDRTLNPLGLRLGTLQHDEMNGAIVGGIILEVALLLIGGLAAAGLWHGTYRDRLRERDVGSLVPEKGSHSAGGGLDKVVKGSNTNEDLTYIAARSRFGWLVMPGFFLYGGAVVSGVYAVLYSETLYKVLGGIHMAVVGVGFPYVSWRACRGLLSHAEVMPICQEGEKQSCMSLFWWGRGEWVSFGDDMSQNYSELFKLFYDGYTRPCYRFMLVEIGLTGLLAVVSAWDPPTHVACWVQSAILTGILLVHFLILLYVRPFLAPYENIMEGLVVFAQVVMMVFVLIAMKQDEVEIDDHWSTRMVGHLALVVVVLVLAKFVMDIVVAVIDEYHQWQTAGSPGSFARWLLCCGTANNDLRRRGVVESSDLGLLEQAPSQDAFSPLQQRYSPESSLSAGEGEGFGAAPVVPSSERQQYTPLSVSPVLGMEASTDRLNVSEYGDSSHPLAMSLRSSQRVPSLSRRGDLTVSTTGRGGAFGHLTRSSSVHAESHNKTPRFRQQPRLTTNRL